MNTSLTELKQSAPISTLPKARQFPAMLESFKGEIARALPKHLNADRLARIALTEFRKNPRLAECDPRSVFAAVVQASQLGLEPGLMGQAYLIPYRHECQLIPGYQGLVDLVRRTGRVKRIEAHVVRDGDLFRYRTGLTTTLDHEPILDGEPGEMRLAYAVAELSDGGYHVEVMTRAEIEKIRDRSSNVQRARSSGKTTPWDTDAAEMWRKTVLRRICKYLPKSAELATALALDDASDHGQQRLSVPEAIEGSWAPEPAEEEPEITAVESAPAPAPEPKATPAWPRQITDPETGEVGWQDASGAWYDERVHGWSAAEERPSVTSAGLFRARRGTSGAPRPAAEQSEARPATGELE